MYNIYSILMFLVLTISSFVISTFMPANSESCNAATVIGVILGITTLINFFILFFGSLHSIQEFKEKMNEIDCIRKKLSIHVNKLEYMKKYYEDYLMKLTPAHENEIFEKIVKNRPGELTALFETYPELKSSVVVGKLMDDLKKYIEEKYQYETQIAYELSTLHNMKNNPWHINLPEIPSRYMIEIESNI